MIYTLQNVSVVQKKYRSRGRRARLQDRVRIATRVQTFEGTHVRSTVRKISSFFCHREPM